MTNEELDRARADQAAKNVGRLGVYGGSLDIYSISTLCEAARLAREGWTPPEPPEPVDPDLLELETLWLKYADGKINSLSDTVLAGIKRGRALAAEAKPRMVWVRYDGSGKCPIDRKALVMVVYGGGDPIIRIADGPAWEFVSHYAVITLPAEDVA